MRTETCAPARVRQALKLVQKAQHLLCYAAERIHGIRGLSREFNRLRELYDEVTASWYRIEYRLDQGDFGARDTGGERFSESQTGSEVTR